MHHAENIWTYRTRILWVTGMDQTCWIPVKEQGCLATENNQSTISSAWRKESLRKQRICQEYSVVTQFIANFVANMKVLISNHGIFGVPKYLEKPMSHCCLHILYPNIIVGLIPVLLVVYICTTHIICRNLFLSDPSVPYIYAHISYLPSISIAYESIYTCIYMEVS